MDLDPLTPLLTVAEVARLTTLSEHTIRAAVRDGELAATKLRGRIRVTSDDLAAWIDAGRVKPPAISTQPEFRAPAPRPARAIPGDPREMVKALRKARAADGSR